MDTYRTGQGESKSITQKLPMPLFLLSQAAGLATCVRYWTGTHCAVGFREIFGIGCMTTAMCRDTEVPTFKMKRCSSIVQMTNPLWCVYMVLCVCVRTRVLVFGCVCLCSRKRVRVGACARVCASKRARVCVCVRERGSERVRA